LKNFDEKLRDRLYDAEMNVSDSIWGAIESNLDKVERKPNLWIMFLMVSFLLPIVFFLLDSSEKTDTHNTNIDSVKIETLTALNEKTATENIINFNTVKSVTSNNQKKLDAPLNLSSRSSVVSLIKNLNNNTGQSSQLSNLTNNTHKQTSIIENSTNELNSVLLKFGKVSALPELSHEINNLSYNSDKNYEIDALFAAKPKCPRFSKPKPRIYLNADFTSAITSLALSSNNPELDHIVDFRNRNEKGLISFASTLGIGIQFRNGIYLESGINYSKINSVFTHEIEGSGKETSIIIRDTIPDPNEDVGYRIEITESTIYESGTITNTYVNNFSQLDIPFKIGYQYDINDKHKLRVDGGVYVNIKSWNQGHVMNIEDEVVEYGSSTSNEIFRSHVGLGYGGSLSFTTLLSPRLSLNTGLSLRHHPNQSIGGVNEINQSYTNFGLQTGINYRL